MTELNLSASCAHRERMPTTGFHRAALPSSQHGVVLVIALVLLVLISLLAITSLRNASSSENVAGNARTAELANQAADIALRYCEAKALKMSADEVMPDSSIDQWKNLAMWDKPAADKPWNAPGSPAASAYVLPEEAVNQPGMTITYKRFPECMVEKLSVPTTSTSTFYIITARGFGPEVPAANAARSRPSGSEVWLQSHIELQ